MFQYIKFMFIRNELDMSVSVEIKICIGNSMICSDIWHKYHERYFEIVIRNFTSR